MDVQHPTASFVLQEQRLRCGKVVIQVDVLYIIKLPEPKALADWLDRPMTSF